MENKECFYEIMCYQPYKNRFIVLKITFNQFLIDKRTQRHHPLLSVTFCGLDSDRIVEKHVSSFYAKHVASRIWPFFRKMAV